MPANTATKRFSVRAGETLNAAVDIKGLLPINSAGASTEKATGTPVIIEINTGVLGLSNKAVSIATLFIDGNDRVAGEAIQFTVTGFVSGSYGIDITFVTTGTQTRECTVYFDVKN
jgi:hypothetical protein